MLRLGLFLRAFLVAILLGLFARTFVVQVFRVTSHSMEGTLLPGDHVLVNRMIFSASRPVGPFPLRSPRRGEILLFRSPEAPFPYLTKRCLGLPGERIAVHENRVWIGGKALDEPYANIPEGRRSLAVEVRRSTLVPPAHLFVLGDHRGASRDSRSYGSVATSRLRGRVVLVLWSQELPPSTRTRSGKWGTISRSKDSARTLPVGRPGRWLRPVR